MSADDILYDKIKSPNGTKRMLKRRIDKYIEVEFEVTTVDGEEEFQIKTITVESVGPPAAKVVVDSKTIIDPNPPVYQDEYCYLKETRDIPQNAVLKKHESYKKTPVRNTWTPADFGYVGCNASSVTATANDNYSFSTLSATPITISEVKISNWYSKK
jgi:hypothetical protein